MRGSPSSIATRSETIAKGDAPTMNPREVPRVSPYHCCFPDNLGAKPLSFAGDGTLPSEVWPYQILFMTSAWRLSRQVLFGPLAPALLHNNGLSRVGS